MRILQGFQRPIRAAMAYILGGIIWVWSFDIVLYGWKHIWSRDYLQTDIRVLFVFVSGSLFALILHDSHQRKLAAERALHLSYDQAIRSLVTLLDAYHGETHDHSQRVARMTVALARLSGISEAVELKRIEFGSLLHDIGKLVVPDHILSKEGPLTNAEMDIVRQHPDKGRELLERVDFLRPCIDIVYCHHERWEGGGYPRGLRGEQIPYAARIFSVIDVWDALINTRVYKASWPEQQVHTYIAEQAGHQFDPKVVRLFLEHYESLVKPERTPSLSLGEIQPPTSVPHPSMF